ncbi:hypothetical protein DV735_g3813, partial [Chaetothyriales sp. CBS 134920]
MGDDSASIRTTSSALASKDPVKWMWCETQWVNLSLQARNLGVSKVPYFDPETMILSKEVNGTMWKQLTRLYTVLGEKKAPYAAPLLIDVGTKNPPELKWFSYLDEEKGSEEALSSTPCTQSPISIADFTAPTTFGGAGLACELRALGSLGVCVGRRPKWRFVGERATSGCELSIYFISTMPFESIPAAESPSSRRAKTNKRSTNSYPSDEWKKHRALITRLYFEEDRTLKDVREVLEKEHNFTPSERMYKSRLHSWGLDKKKKEHEMLDLVRQGLELEGDDKDKVFIIRGRSVTLADAMHYFNRKGIKDPTILLDQTPLPGSLEVSSPDDGEGRTPLSTGPDSSVDAAGGRPESDYDMRVSPSMRPILSMTPPSNKQTQSARFAELRLASIQAVLGIRELKPMPAFRTLPVESMLSPGSASAEENRYLEAVFLQLQAHYRSIFMSRNMSVNDSAWTATSDDADADKFYHSMYHGYNYLWSGQREEASKCFLAASELIRGLIKDNHVAFLIYVLDLLIRHDGTGHEEPLLEMLQHVSDMAMAVFGTESQPIYLIALWLRNAPVSRSWLAEGLLRKLLDFFQDCIGYFHEETIALLQTFATGLLNCKKYPEAALRFQQLVDAFETTQGKEGYEVCYALRSTSEAFFHMGQYAEALQALKAALERSRGLEHEEEREIYVRCVRALAEISNKLGRREEAIETMQHVVESTRDAFGPDHPFSHRARMHLKSVQNGVTAADSVIPPMVYRLGRGGSAAKALWTTRASPTRLIP